MQQNRKHIFQNTVRHWKLVLLSAGIPLLIMCSVTYMMAWLTAQDNINNEFDIGTVSVEIRENFSEPFTEKSDVKVINTGNATAYVRAVVSVYWQSDDGTILPDIPVENQDYIINFGTSGNWKKNGDIYYYLQPLEPGNTTDNLIDNCKQIGSVSDGKKLAVDISVQTIQSEPTDVVEESWKVQVGADGNLSLETP